MSEKTAANESVYKTEERVKMSFRQTGPALLIIALGVVLLLANVFNLNLMRYLWPGFIIAPGLLMLWPAYDSTAERQNPLAFLAVPGAMVTVTGLLLFVMNLTNHFEAWAYSWTLVIASVAGGIMYIKRFDPHSSVHEAGRNFIRAMLILFMGLAVFFELLIFGNYTPLLPVAMIAYGVYLLVKNRRENA